MKLIIYILILSHLGLSVHAAEWSNTSVSYLTGQSYRNVNDTVDSYQILTLEHASAWRYGDNYFFTDISDFNSDNTQAYTEWSSRFSSHKILKKNYAHKYLEDVLLATQVNFTPGGSRVDLIGAGLDLKVPLFDFVQLNAYLRNNNDLSGSTYQLTLAWQARFTKTVNWKFSGFMDLAGSEGSGANKSNQNFLMQSQFTWVANKEFELGLEYLYWSNKYGIKDLDESVPQIIAKWNL
ncbi:MAG: hypothetical protein HON90_10110 [Halobacteriovoraceae bacterium]|nr:hypothetical protein [Halobacteriovoraceae bacterium]